jgi:hypothetical protein
MTELASPERVLWLHFGTHKTGTTSRQKGLRPKRDVLAQSGVQVWPEKNAWRLANLFLRPSLKTLPRVAGTATLPTLGDIGAASDLVRQNLGAFRQMIISSEQFCMLRDALEGYALVTVLRSVFDRIVPIVVLRNLADRKASREDQLRRTALWEFQKSLPDDQSADGDWYYHHAAIVAFWQNIGPTCVLDYDEACARDGSVLPAMAQALGRPGLFADLALHLNRRTAVGQP